MDLGVVGDSLKTSGSMLKQQVTMKPEQLTKDKLEQAKGLASVLTGIRKGVYFAFPLFTTAVVITYVKSMIPEYGYWFLIVMLIVYGLFKLRDLIRGTI